MPFDDELYRLRLFNEKAARLENSGLVKGLLAHGMRFTIEMQPSSTKYSLEDFDQDVIDAFVLNYRFFSQDNEPISFRNMAEFYEGLPIDEAKKQGFKQIRQKLNDFLDAPSGFGINNDVHTYRRIVETCVYGGLAHANKPKKLEYDGWMRTPGMAQMILYEFNSALVQILNSIVEAAALNDEAIKELEEMSNR
jgi:hypothetical protein